jgi:hypothetical protein
MGRWRESAERRRKYRTLPEPQLASESHLGKCNKVLQRELGGSSVLVMEPLAEITAGYVAGTIDRPTYIAAVVANHAAISASSATKAACVCFACSQRKDH